MVEDEFFDITLKLTEEDLNKLDRLAEELSSKVKKSRKKKESTTKKGEGKLTSVLQSDLGVSKGQRAISMLSNPIGFMQNLLTRQLPILGGILAAGEIVKFIFTTLTQKGGLLDRFFKNIIDNRIDALRDKTLQQEILIGQTQIISTSITGLTDVRNIYNSFEVAQRDRELLEDDFAIRQDDITP